MMRAHILHITKDDFFPPFHAAGQEKITKAIFEEVLEGGGLLSSDPERVISTLDLKLKTPTPPNSRPRTSQPWVSQTPNNLIPFCKGCIENNAPVSVVKSREPVSSTGK